MIFPKKFQLIIVEKAKKKRHTATKMLPNAFPTVAFPKIVVKVIWKECCTMFPLDKLIVPAMASKDVPAELTASPVIAERGPSPV